jgi:NADH:ubiquinone oxidoreductase subunit 2 (subunit N)
MYFREPEVEFEIAKSKTGVISIILSGIIVVVLGIFPGSVLDKIASSIINF